MVFLILPNLLELVEVLAAIQRMWTCYTHPYIQCTLAKDSHNTWNFIPYGLSSLTLSIAVCRYTSKNEAIYAIALEWPSTGVLNLTVPVTSESTTVTLLGLPDVKISWMPLSDKNGISIMIPGLSVSELPCQWAWVFKMIGVH